jgi:hypothetical protein
MSNDGDGGRQRSGSTGATLALIISVMSGLVSVSTFGFGFVNEVRGSNVHLFPVELVSFYKVPFVGRDGVPNPELDRLGISFRTEFANTAGSSYPDSIVAQHVEVDVDGQPFACFADRGEVRVIAAPLQSGLSSASTGTDCGNDLCIALQDRSLLRVATDGPLRQALPPGAITSNNRYFDARGIVSTHACAEIIQGNEALCRPLAAGLLQDAPAPDNQAWTRTITVRYHVETLQDGSFTATCAVQANAGQIDKFRTDGWVNLGCDEAQTPSHARRTFWGRISAIFD